MAEQLAAILGARMTHNTNKLLNGANVNNDVSAIELGLEKLVDDQIFPASRPKFSNSHA